MPPYLTDQTNLLPLELVLTVRGADGLTIPIDFAHLTPIDNYKFFSPRGYGIGVGERLNDDAVAGRLYGASSTGAAAGIYIGSGELLISPDATQRFYFWRDTGTGNYKIDDTSSIRMWYRPRVLSV
jgi:hypothetical protein